MKRLKVGLIVDAIEVNFYVYQLCEYLVTNENFEKPTIITGHKKIRIRESLLKKFFRKIKNKRYGETISRLIFYFLFKIIRKLESRKVRSIFPNYGILKSLSILDLDFINLKGMWSNNGFFLTFNEGELGAIKARNFDVLIRCGAGILKGDILHVAKHGVLSFHHGDDRVNRGGPSGFWEVFNGELTSGFIIQRLNEELDGGEVMFRGNIRTSAFWTLNNAFLLEKSNCFMIKVLNRLYKQGSLHSNDAFSLHHNELYKLNGSSVLLIKYIIKVYGPVALRKIKRIFIFNDPKVARWSVGYAPYSKLRASLFRYKEITNPKGRFLADPFVITHEGKSICFVEDFFYADRKGKISAIELRDDGYEFLGVVLEEDFHLSYPFVFRHKDDIYMIPETHRSKQIRLYRCEQFPMYWVYEKTLMKDVIAADTSLIKKDNLWYLFTNICSAQIGDTQSELHIFYTKDFNLARWTPLKCGNPVLFDPARARNAGMFVIDDMLIRSNQIFEKRYGYRFSLNQVLQLDPINFREQRLDNIFPCFKKDIVATHHFHTDNKFSVIDFMRYEKLRKINF